MKRMFNLCSELCSTAARRVFRASFLAFLLLLLVPVVFGQSTDKTAAPSSPETTQAASSETPAPASDTVATTPAATTSETASAPAAAVPAVTETAQAAPAAAEAAPVVETTVADPDKSEKKVVGVEIVGNQIISTQTIISKMRTRKGAILRQQMVNEDIKRLYSAGYFEDIQVKLEEMSDGYKLYVTVVEKPVIKEILISGHTIYKDEKLRKTLGVVEGEVIDENKLNKGIEEIRKLYEKKGFRFIEIKSDIQKDTNSGQATIQIRIEEGKKYNIRKLAKGLSEEAG